MHLNEEYRSGHGDSYQTEGLQYLQYGLDNRRDFPL